MNESITTIETVRGNVVHSNAETGIRPRSGRQAFNIVEILRSHELLWMFAYGNIQVGYKQILLGVLWAVVQLLPPWSCSASSLESSRASQAR